MCIFAGSCAFHGNPLSCRISVVFVDAQAASVVRRKVHVGRPAAVSGGTGERARCTFLHGTQVHENDFVVRMVGVLGYTTLNGCRSQTFRVEWKG